MPAAWIGAAVGVYNAYEGSKHKSSSQPNGAPAAAADPFASQRPQYQQMLSNMMTGGGGWGGNSNGGAAAPGPLQGAFTDGGGGGFPAASSPSGGGFTPTDPSYQWRLNQGLESVNRGAAASGLLNSGNRLAELMNYGQGQASTEYANQFSRLSQLAGANIGSPAAAGQLAYQQQGNSSAYLQQLGNLAAPYVKSWWNGTGNSSSGSSGSGSGDGGWTGADWTSGDTAMA